MLYSPVRTDHAAHGPHAQIQDEIQHAGLAEGTVDVQMQNNLRQRFTTTIAQVGAQLEAITNALAFKQTGALVDMGLPIVLAVPANVHLRPGEIVNVALHSKVGIFGRDQPNASEASKPVARVQ